MVKEVEKINLEDKNFKTLYSIKEVQKILDMAVIITGIIFIIYCYVIENYTQGMTLEWFFAMCMIGINIYIIKWYLIPKLRGNN